MKKTLLVCVAMLFAAQAGAQIRGTWVPEVRPFVGAYLPTGDQRDVLKDSALMGMEFAYELPINVHLLGTVGWTPSTDKALTQDNRVNLFQYDVGAELFNSRPMTGDWLFRPFVGLGVGARTYDMTEIRGAKAKTYAAGYGALGSEFQLSNIAIRIEGRDYLSQFKGLAGGADNKTRNDVTLAAALAFHFR
jgi:hypothetical protein